MKLLENKVVIITGAARPRGMGQAAARKFGEHGARVVVTDLVRDEFQEEDTAAIERVAARVRELGTDALGIGVDVTRRDQVRDCVSKTIEAFGTVDVMVNNAGTSVGSGLFLELTDEQWDRSFQVHLKGCLYFCQAVIPIMQKAGGGVIVNNASMLGLAAEAYSGAYTATKFGVVGLSKTIAAEFGGDNIRCNAVCPGSVKTQMQIDGLNKYARWQGLSLEQAWKEAERNALDRSAEPEEVANVMVWLASPMSSFVSGAAIPVTGAANPGV